MLLKASTKDATKRDALSPGGVSHSLGGGLWPLRPPSSQWPPGDLGSTSLLTSEHRPPGRQLLPGLQPQMLLLLLLLA